MIPNFLYKSLDPKDWIYLSRQCIF